LPQERKPQQTKTNLFTLREVVLIILLLTSLVYIFLPKKSPTFDDSKYNKTIDSLNNVLQISKMGRDSLVKETQEREIKIADIRKELNKLKITSKEYEKKYKEQVDIINRMSNDDIVRAFSDTFN
jgi:septal ring factor EnvC (AmiA/AmiB activator)